MRKITLVLASLAIALSMTGAPADPWPDDPYGFCMPDLDGHCRYCEIRFDHKIPHIRCVG